MLSPKKNKQMVIRISEEELERFDTRLMRLSSVLNVALSRGHVVRGMMNLLVHCEGDESISDDIMLAYIVPTIAEDSTVKPS